MRFTTSSLPYWVYSVQTSVVIVKPGGTGIPSKIHLGQVGTLTAEEVSHLGIAFGLAVAECIDSFSFDF